MSNSDKMKNKSDVLRHYGVGDIEELSRMFYKQTQCGACCLFVDKGHRVGSIVEGSETDFFRTILYPFTQEDVDYWIAELEVLCEKEWQEANGGEQ